MPRLEGYVRLRARGVLGGVDGVSDLVQSTCRELLEHADRFREGGDDAFRHWLYTTAARKIIDRHRYHAAQRRDAGLHVADHEASRVLAGAFGLEPSPSDVAAGAELLERMESAFEGLAEDEREVILLARVVGLSRAETARAIGRTENATRNLLNRSLAKLAGVLDRGSS